MNLSRTVIVYDKSQVKFSNDQSIEYFQNAEQCFQSIQNSSTSIFLILNSKNATDLLSRVDSLTKVETIFIYCSTNNEKQRCQYLVQHYKKIFDLFDNREDLMNSVEQLKNLGENPSGNEYFRLAEIYRTKNDFNRSIQLINRALDLYRKTFHTENHPLIAKCFNTLGGIYDIQGDVNRSFESYEQAIKIYAALTPQLKKQQNKSQKK